MNNVDWESPASHVAEFLRTAQPGQMLHISARRQTGKTTFLQSVAATHGAVFVPLERRTFPRNSRGSRVVVFVDEPGVRSPAFWRDARTSGAVVVSAGTPQYGDSTAEFHF